MFYVSKGTNIHFSSYLDRLLSDFTVARFYKFEYHLAMLGHVAIDRTCVELISKPALMFLSWDCRWIQVQQTLFESLYYDTNICTKNPI